jgi:rod shape-determining protein MreC
VASAARLGNKVDAGLLVGCVVLSLVAVVLKDEDREPIAAALRRTIVAPLVGLQRGAEKWRTAWAASQQQRVIVDSLTMKTIKTQAFQSENDQLRKLLGLGTRLEWGFVPAEALHSTTPTEELVTTLTLTAGSTAGVKRYSPVVAPDGLVGTVQNADPTMSIAILYTHPDFRASAMSADGSAFGIVYPRGRGERGESYLLELRHIPTRIELKPGTTIYTSGLGGTYPRGIAIGTIVQEIKTAEVWTRTYLVRPAVSPSRLSTVLILSPQRVTQGTGNVWGAAATNADSASKRIVAAGDSVTKAAAALEARARQAVLDSVKRSAIDSVRRSLGMPAVPLTAADSAAQAAQGVRSQGPVQVPAQTIRPDSLRARRVPPDTTRRDSLGRPIRRVPLGRPIP